MPWGKARIETAYKCFLSSNESCCFILSGGKQLDFDSEALLMKALFLGLYPESLARIFLEENSVDTLQNAFFTKMLHLEPLKIKNISVVSNAFHIPRVKQIFTSLFDSSYKMEFLSAVDPVVDEWIANKQLDIEKGAREFNENRLFCSDVYENLSALHSLIFEPNSIIAEDYRNLMANF